MVVAEVSPPLGFEQGKSGLLVPDLDPKHSLYVADAVAFMQAFVRYNGYAPEVAPGLFEEFSYEKRLQPTGLNRIVGSGQVIEQPELEGDLEPIEQWNHPSLARIGGVLGIERHAIYPNGFTRSGKVLFSVDIRPVVMETTHPGQVRQRAGIRSLNGWVTDRYVPADQREGVEEPLRDLRRRLLG